MVRRPVTRHTRKSYPKGIKTLSQKILCATVLMALFGASSLIGQEPDTHAPQAQGARRNAPGATREFLGLGPAPDPAAAKKGESLFKENCSTCHGENARGAQGPNLVRSVLVLHDENDEEIEPVVKNGRPQGGMPPFPQLTHEEVHNICQYLKLQVELAANRGTYGQTYSESKNAVTGDATKGEEFFNKNCKNCHSATGDLARIGVKFPQSSLMQSRFVWPVSREPRRITVTTRSGERVTGAALVLDDFDVSIRDSNGNYRYWPASEVTVQVVDKLQGHRSLLPKYSDADLHNITAFLETLK